MCLKMVLKKYQIADNVSGRHITDDNSPIKIKQ